MIKLILILTVIYIVFYLLSTNVYDELKEVTKTCLDNNPEMINICTSNTSNISSNFTRCFTSKLDTLINKNENKNPLKKVIDYLRTLPSGKMDIISSLTGLKRIEKIRFLVCNMINKEKILEDKNIMSEIISEEL